MAFPGELSGAFGEQAILNIDQLDLILVDRRVLVAGIQILLVAVGNLSPEALALVPTESKGTGDPNGPDGIQFVGVVQNPGFGSLWSGAAAEAVGGDGMGHRLNFIGRLAGQQAASIVGTRLSVLVPQPVPLSPSHIVEEGGCAHDLEIGALLLGQAFGEGQDTQHVVKVMDGIGSLIVQAGLFDGDQLGSPMLSTTRRGPEIEPYYTIARLHRLYCRRAHASLTLA
jgi:hypothetical protein